MIERIDISLFDKYLAGELSRDQLRDVDGNLLTDAQIDTALTEHEEVTLHLEAVALKAALQEKYSGTEIKSRKNGYKVWAVAAAVVALATFGFLWQRNNASPNLDDYFTHFEQIDSFRGDATSAYARGMEAYTRRHYREAFTLLEQVAEPNNEVYFFKGVSALVIGEYEAAIEAFELSGTDSTNRYYQQTRWYMALGLWQHGQVEAARVMLELIGNDDMYYEQAQELIQALP